MRMADECWEISANYIKDTLGYKQILADIYRRAKTGNIDVEIALEKNIKKSQQEMIMFLLEEEGFECKDCGKNKFGASFYLISWNKSKTI